METATQSELLAAVYDRRRCRKFVALPALIRAPLTEKDRGFKKEGDSRRFR